MVEAALRAYLPWELKIIEIYGTKQNFAEIFDPPVSINTVSNWRREGIPPRRVFEIERLTEHRITRYDMRPDLFGDQSDGE